MLQSLRLETPGLAGLAARAPQWVAGLLVILLGGRAAWLVADLAGATRGARGTAAPATAAAPQLPPRLDLASLIAANLFGAAASQQGPAPITNVPLVLVGVMAAQDPHRGIAILGPTATATKVYLVGNTLPGGVRLNAVYPDRVLIDRGGSIETLPLPHQSNPSAPPPSPPPTANTVDRMQQIVQQNPGLVSNVLRPQVVLADGKQKGFRVFPGPNQKAFSKLGLHPGDLVTAINGTTLDDPAVGNNVFGTLSNSPNAHVTVMRDGRQQDLVINLAQAVNEAERLSNEPAAQAPADPTGPLP